MSPELDKALCEKYPKIFADRNGNMMNTAMCWGFECGDGWYNIIDTLCAFIQNRIDYRNEDIERITKLNDLINEYLAGNQQPLIDYAKKLTDMYVDAGIKEVPPVIPQVVATQVKEKFGGLRFYINGGDDEIDAAITFAEMLSERTCEVCGAPGKQRGGGWISTRCDEHV